GRGAHVRCGDRDREATWRRATLERHRIGAERRLLTAAELQDEAGELPDVNLAAQLESGADDAVATHARPLVVHLHGEPTGAGPPGAQDRAIRRPGLDGLDR